jgi:hypothetical protein
LKPTPAPQDGDVAETAADNPTPTQPPATADDLSSLKADLLSELERQLGAHQGDILKELATQGVKNNQGFAGIPGIVEKVLADQAPAILRDGVKDLAGDAAEAVDAKVGTGGLAGLAALVKGIAPAVGAAVPSLATLIPGIGLPLGGLALLLHFLQGRNIARINSQPPPPPQHPQPPPQSGPATVAAPSSTPESGSEPGAPATPATGVLSNPAQVKVDTAVVQPASVDTGLQAYQAMKKMALQDPQLAAVLNKPGILQRIDAFFNQAYAGLAPKKAG